jgi:hypothetical protein
MINKNKFNIVILVGTITLAFIISTFPCFMYFAFQEKTNEVIQYNPDHIKQFRHKPNIHSNNFNSLPLQRNNSLSSHPLSKLQNI